jgi:mRNA interferase MazF
MQRGEIWWANLDPPAGKRPVILLSRDEAYSIRSLVIIAPITTRIRNIPSEVMLTTADGLPKDCVINLNTITTIDKDSLQSRLTIISPEKLKKVDNAIRFSLGLE